MGRLGPKREAPAAGGGQVRRRVGEERIRRCVVRERNLLPALGNGLASDIGVCGASFLTLLTGVVAHREVPAAAPRYFRRTTFSSWRERRPAASVPARWSNANVSKRVGATPTSLVDLDLLPFLAVTALVMAVPGPSVLYAVTQRLERGRTAGVAAVLGLETGLLVHVLAACLGVSALIAASPSMLSGLRFAGAGYLVLLGLRQLGFGLPRPARPRLNPPPPADRRRPGNRPRPHHRHPGGTSCWRPTGPIRPYGCGPCSGPGCWWTYSTPRRCPSSSPCYRSSCRAAPTASAAAVMVICVVGLGLAFDGGYAALAGGLQRRGLPPSAVGPRRWPVSASWPAAVTVLGWTVYVAHRVGWTPTAPTRGTRPARRLGCARHVL